MEKRPKGLLIAIKTSSDNIAGTGRERFMIELKFIEKCFFKRYCLIFHILQNNYANVSQVAFNKTFLFFEIGIGNCTNTLDCSATMPTFTNKYLYIYVINKYLYIYIYANISKYIYIYKYTNKFETSYQIVNGLQLVNKTL